MNSPFVTLPSSHTHALPPHIAVAGFRDVLVKVVGERTKEFEVPELLNVPVASVDVLVTSKVVDGKTLPELAKAPTTLTWQRADSEIDKLADKRIKAFFLVNPSNPPSLAMRGNSMRRLVKLVKTQRRLPVLSGKEGACLRCAD